MGRFFWVVYLILSSSLHLALWLALEPKPLPKTKEKEFEKFEVEIQEAKVSFKNAEKKKGNGLKRSSKISLKKLVPQYKVYSNGLETSQSDKIQNDDPSAPWGEGGSDFTRIEDFIFMDQIFYRVNSMVRYPGILSSKGMQGTVQVRLVFGAKGNCLWKYSTIDGSNRYFQVYVLSILKKLCKTNFANYMRGRKRVNVDMSFSFDLSEYEDSDLVAQRNLVQGNVLLFYRYAQKSSLEWKLGPIRGFFLVPAVSLDIPWLIEKWDEVIHDKDYLKDFYRDRKQISEP